MAKKKSSRSNKPGKPNKKRDGRPRGKRGKQTSRDKPKSEARDNTIDLQLAGMANGGYAIGFHKRRPTFVPYAIPGETIRARITEKQDRVDFAEGVTLLQSSADRVLPKCDHFGPGKCWGCQWQHIDYKAQLLLKQDVLADQLYRVGRFEDEVISRALRPLVPSPQKWGYNAHMTLLRRQDGTFGFYQMDGRSIAQIEICHVLHPDLQALYEMLDIDFEDLERLTLWRGSDAETMIVMEMNSENAPQLRADFPTSVNVTLPDNEPVNLVGDSSVYFEVGDRLFRVTAGGFFRANVEQINNLIASVLKMLDLTDADSVLDLYAGVGVFSAFIAPRAGLVTLVESYPPMATDAEENLKAFDNVDIIEGTVEAVLASLIEAGEKYEVALLDPPSRGLRREARELLCELNIPKLVYVSSDPASLSQDLRHLVAAGYQIETIQPFDFAPQTYYVDVAVLLTR